MTGRQLTIDLAATVLLIAWTGAAAVVFLWASVTLNVDASCDGPPQRDFRGGGWAAFVVPPMWASAFLGVAAQRRHTAWWVVVSVVAVIACALVLQAATADATAICW